MKTRLLSVLLVFLLLASVSIPSVSAIPVDQCSEQCSAPQIYYELRNLCVCNAKEDLGHIPFLNWGIGYKAWVDKQTNYLEIFINAGLASKKLKITPKTDLDKLTALKDFIMNVDKCRYEMDQIPGNALHAVISGTMGSIGIVGGALFDNGPAVAGGTVSASYGVEQIAELTKHFDTAKHAQENAEKLFGKL